MKKLLCPHCKKDLKETGFRTAETIYKNFDWEWDKKKGYFENDDGETDSSEVDGIYCNNCNNEISDFVRNNELI